MRTVLLIALVTLLPVATRGMAANIEYEYPNLTIVAKDEPLQSVLKSLGSEMRISVTTPAGLNPSVSCNIEKQPVKQALKTLLGELSYSMEWDENSGELVGLAILGSGTGTAVAATPESRSSPGGTMDVDSSTASNSGPRGSSAPVDHGAPTQDSGPAMDAGRADWEERMEEERAAHEADREQRRQQEEIAQEARMQEEVKRHDDEMRAYIESQGLTMPQ